LTTGFRVRSLPVRQNSRKQDGIVFCHSPRVQAGRDRIIHLIEKNRSYKLAGRDRILLLPHCPGLNDKVAAAKNMIRELTQ